MKPINRNIRIGAMLALVVFVGMSPRSWAASDQVTNSNEEQRQQSLDLESFEKWRKSLSEERQILERQADRQYEAVDGLMNRALWVFGVLGTVVLGLFVWFFGKSKNDFKKTISDTFERQARDIVENEAEKLRQRYENLKAEVEDLSAYKRRQIAWVARPDSQSPELVIKALYAMGIQNISFVTPEEGQEFELGDPDLVILTFDDSDEARRLLSILVGRLKQESPPVPLLIYTFSAGGAQIRFGDVEFEILKGFDWYVPVNFPAQLLAQTQLLIRRSRNLLGGTYGQL